MGAYHRAMRLLRAAGVEGKFYHITRRRSLESILERGLDPGKSAKGMVYLSPDLGHVRAYAGSHFGEADASGSVVLEVDAAMLDGGLLGPDDDDLQDILDDEGDGRDWRDVPWDESVRMTGQCTYRGVIPPRALRALPDDAGEPPTVRLGAARRPWDVTLGELDAMFPRAGGAVDGRAVRGGEVPNISSVGASMENSTVLRGVREVPMSAFGPAWAPKFYSKGERERTTGLAEEIRGSGEVTPLIVAYDDEGPYVLEGGHRFDALNLLGARSFPALVALDEGALHSAVESALRAGEPVRPEVLGEYPGLAGRRAASKLPYFSSCVSWPRELLPALELLIDEGKEIGKRQFLSRAGADPNDFPRMYHADFRYFRYGPDVYWFTHSAIEHVFAEDESIRAVQRAAEAAQASQASGPEAARSASPRIQPESQFIA